MSKKKWLSPFGKGMLIYVGVFLLLCLAVWTFFYFYIETYEVAGSKGCMREYVSGLHAGQLPEACDEPLKQLDASIKSEEESRALLQELLSDATYMRTPGESGEGYEVYSLFGGGQELGRVRVEPTGKERFGFALWQVTEENYDLQPLTKNVSFLLPADYSVSVGKAELKAEGKGQEYESLRQLYGEYENMPLLYDFVSGSWIGDAEIVIRDGQGTVLSEEQLCESYYLSNLSGEEKTLVEDFGTEFIHRYVDYGAVNGGNFFYNFSRLKAVMDPYGELYARVNSGWGGIFYTSTKYCEILSLEVNFSTKLQEDLYLVDLSYETETQGLADPVRSDNNARVLVIRDDHGVLLSTAMYNY